MRCGRPDGCWFAVMESDTGSDGLLPTEPPVTIEQIDAILPFLATFEAGGYCYGEWQAPEGSPWIGL
jgi:hypothetical protein